MLEPVFDLVGCGAMEAWQALPYPTMQATLQDLENMADMVIYLVIGYYQQIMLSVVCGGAAGYA